MLESEREGHGNHLAATADPEDQAETKAEINEEMNDASDAIAMLEDKLDRKDAQVKELLNKLTMLFENGTSVKRWMDIAMDGEVSSDGKGRGNGSSDGRGNRIKRQTQRPMEWTMDKAMAIDGATDRVKDGAMDRATDVASDGRGDGSSDGWGNGSSNRRSK